MLQLMVRLECRRQGLIRKMALRQIGESGMSLWGIAGLLFFVALFPLLVTAPVSVAEVPSLVEFVGGLAGVGLVLCLTIVGAPIGFVLL